MQDNAAPAPVMPPQGKSSRKPFLILALFLLATLLAFGLYGLLTRGEEGTDDAQVAADVSPVAARVPGQILKVVVVENQAVKAGDLLVQMDPADYAARVRQAEAELDTAKAQSLAADAQVGVVEASSRGGFFSAQAGLEGSNQNVESAHAQVAAAKAAVARSEADAHKAELDVKRARELRATGAVPQAWLDNAEAVYDATTAAREQARASLAAMQGMERVAHERVGEAKGRVEQTTPVDAQIAAAKAQAELAKARIQVAEAALELAKLQLSYTQITAPFDGTASRLTAREGQMVQPGQSLIALVPNTTYVVANFKETQITKMRVGQKVDVEVDSFPGRTLHGHVASLAGGTGAMFSLLPPDNATGNFVKVVQRVPVRIAWDDLPADLALRAGLSADVTVHVE